MADEAAEQALLGVTLKRGDALRALAGKIAADDFYYERNRIVFRALLALDEQNEPVNLVTVGNRLRLDGDLESAGGLAYLSVLANETPSAAHVDAYVRIIREHALRRRVVDTARQVVREVNESSAPADTLADEAVRRFMQLAMHGSSNTVVPVSSALQASLQRLEALVRVGDNRGLTGVPSGFYALDRITNGWQRGDLIILAARPGMGKTAFALNMLLNAARYDKRPTAGVFFSLEMSAEQLATRLWCSMARVPIERVRSGDLHDGRSRSDYYDRLLEVYKPLADAPIYIDETAQITVTEMMRKCRQLKHEHNLGLIMVDYLQLMRGSGAGGRNSSREQEISEISRNLKALARELEVPVIALSQLNRSVEKREDKRPQLSDLRESGAIEQDADIISFLYRQAYYDRLAGKVEDQPPPGAERGLEGEDTEVIIAKHRSGQTGKLLLRFHDAWTLFTNRREDAPMPDDDELAGPPTRGFADEDFDAPPPAPAHERTDPPRPPGPAPQAAAAPAPPEEWDDDAFLDAAFEDDDAPF